MLTSESLSKLSPALVSLCADLRAIAKDKVNPAFKSRFASLDAIIDDVRPRLAAHQLAIIQSVEDPFVEAGALRGFTVVTRLIHESGEWLESSVVVPVSKSDAQGAGSSLTYARRYSISALLALSVDDDDDGNSATASKQPAKRAERPAERSAAPKPAVPADRTHKDYGDPYGQPLNGGLTAGERRVRGQQLATMGKDQLKTLQDWAKEKGHDALAKDCNSVLIDLALGKTDDKKIENLQRAEDKLQKGLPFA